MAGRLVDEKAGDLAVQTAWEKVSRKVLMRAVMRAV